MNASPLKLFLKRAWSRGYVNRNIRYLWQRYRKDCNDWWNSNDTFTLYFRNAFNTIFYFWTLFMCSTLQIPLMSLDIDTFYLRNNVERLKESRKMVFIPDKLFERFWDYIRINVLCKFLSLARVFRHQLLCLSNVNKNQDSYTIITSKKKKIPYCIKAIHK